MQKGVLGAPSGPASGSAEHVFFVAARFQRSEDRRNALSQARWRLARVRVEENASLAVERRRELSAILAPGAALVACRIPFQCPHRPGRVSGEGNGAGYEGRSPDEGRNK